MSKEENKDMKEYHITHDNNSLEEAVKAERDPRTVEHHHTDHKNTWPLTISEDRWPAFRKHMGERIPAFMNSDLPFEQTLTERHLTEWEKRMGQSYQDIYEAVQSFATGKS